MHDPILSFRRQESDVSAGNRNRCPPPQGVGWNGNGVRDPRDRNAPAAPATVSKCGYAMTPLSDNLGRRRIKTCQPGDRPVASCCRRQRQQWQL